ncbi:unnamed protein product [Mucor hiemalis]
MFTLRKRSKRSKRRLLLLTLLSKREILSRKRVADNYYTDSASLHRPEESSMQKVLEMRRKGPFIVHFGLTPQAFDSLHESFAKEYPGVSKFGRKRSFHSRMVLALVLTWLRGSMKQETLCLLFGATAATISRAKRLGLGILYKIFSEQRHDERWDIHWPTVEEMGKFNEMVLSNSTNNTEDENLKGVFGFVDGLNLPIENPQDPAEQNAYYNGWKSDTFASQVIVFAPDGTICFINSNNPGSWHDAKIARPLYDKNLTSHRCPEPYKLLADSAFPCRKDFASKILSVPKENSKASKRRTDEEKIRDAIVTKHRQAAEWGMRALQASFGRLHLRLSVNARVRAELLFVIWRLHNFQVRTVGINQIRTVYYKQWVHKNLQFE